MKEKKRLLLLSILILLLSLGLTGLIFIITYNYDNKYTFRNHPDLAVLDDSWEFYPNELYVPDDFAEGMVPAQQEHIFIGQFGTFESYTSDGSPFGCATYRKCFSIADTSSDWLLELPEIFSSCNVYVNGRLVREYGDPSSVSGPVYIRNSLISLPSGPVELVIQARNTTHYYSGMIYPPLLGTDRALTEIILFRFIFYGMACFFTLGTAIASLYIWFHGRNSLLYMSYGLLCIFFAIHTSYPFVHWLGINGGIFPYVVEDISYWAMLSCITLLTYAISRSGLPRHLHMAGYIVCLVLCALVPAAYYILFPSYPNFVSIYGYIVKATKILISLYLIAAAFSGSVKRPHSVWLLAGNAIFGFGILTDAITAGRFEPVRFVWQTEYCGIIMVIIFTILILKHSRSLVLEHEQLTAHLKEEVDTKTLHLSRLLQERRQSMASIAHDMKAPASAINTYVDYLKETSAGASEELEPYLKVIDKKAYQIQEYVSGLQLFHADDGSEDIPGSIDCSSFLQEFHQETVPYTDACGIHYQLRLPRESVCIYARRSSLFRALENLIINATEHTEMNGTIAISAEYGDETAAITVSDTGKGIAPEYIDRIFDYRFSTKQQEGIRGIGLYFTKMTLEEFSGSIAVTSAPGQGTVFTVTLDVVQGP